MKNWHAILISASLITGGFIASSTPGQTASGVWGMTTGPIAYLYNSNTKEVIACSNAGGNGGAFCTKVNLP